jgi:hypothetical protein
MLPEKKRHGAVKFWLAKRRRAGPDIAQGDELQFEIWTRSRLLARGVAASANAD